MRATPDIAGTPSGIPGRVNIVDSLGNDLTAIGLSSGETYQLAALVYDSVTDEVFTGATLAWTSSNPAAATVHATSGLLSYVAAGSTTIQCTATAGGGSANDTSPATVTTSAATVTSLIASTTTVGASEGGAWSFTVQPRDAGGNNLSGRTVTAVSTDNGISGAPSINGYTVSGTGGTAGTATITATCETVDAVGVTCTISAASAAHPHEPVGFTQIGSTIDDCNFPSVEAGWGTNDNGDLSVITKAASGFTWHRAITNVVKKDYTGQAGGSSGLNTFKTGLSVSEFYLDYDYCYGSDYTGHTSRTNKMFFLKGSGTGGGNPFYLGYRIVGAQASAQIELLLQSGIPNVGGNDASGNRRLTTARGVSRDAPFRLEVYVKLNTADVADGVATMWLDKYDGTGLKQEVTATNMAYRGTGAAVAGGAKIAAFHWDPVYGGAGGSAGTGATYLGYLYISGKA